MRPNVSPLQAAWAALKASEHAEREGKIDEALHQAEVAIVAVEAWRYQLGLAK